MRILAIDAASRKCGAAVIEDRRVLGQHVAPIEHGKPSGLPSLIGRVLAASATEVRELGLIVVVVGPGSFTGIRTSLALAHGLSASLGVRLVGVTVAEVASASRRDVTCQMWCAVGGRGGQIILDWGGKMGVFHPEALPAPIGRVAVTGDAGPEVASRLGDKGYHVTSVDQHTTTMLDVALAGEKRASVGDAGHEARPLYIERPAALLPAGGLRSAPVP
jgi:tRNA threonylcarbamoyladenosine biosynthesis protein TsaB